MIIFAEMHKFQKERKSSRFSCSNRCKFQKTESLKRIFKNSFTLMESCKLPIDPASKKLS